VSGNELRKYDPAIDKRMLEFGQGTTVIHIGGVTMSMRLPRDEFLAKFMPDGIWLALSKGIVVGALLLGPCDEAGAPCVAVYGIKVDEPYRRRGIGRTLMRKAEEFARRQGTRRLFLETRRDNVPALALFSECGYTAVASTPDRVRMEKVLQL